MSHIFNGEPSSGVRTHSGVLTHGKEGYGLYQTADSCRQGQSGTAGRSGARSEWRQHHGVLQAVQCCHAEARAGYRSEEHTSELQSLMRISYAVFCWKKQTK